jgi:hypothetical protein
MVAVLKNAPAINICHDFLSFALAMLGLEIFADPCHEVVLESPFDYLVQ